MRTVFLVAGLVLCILGAVVILYEVSESCEDSALASQYRYYPWCSDVLDHVNYTFVGVLALFAGVIVLALGGTLHWLLEPEKPGTGDEGPGADAGPVRGSGQESIGDAAIVASTGRGKAI